MKALIQGASRGIGCEFVRQLAARPDVKQIFACSRPSPRRAELEALAGMNEKIEVIDLDLLNVESIESAANMVGSRTDAIDMLVNVAGLLHDQHQQPERRISEIRAESLQRSFAINSIGPILMARAFEELLKRGNRPVFASLSARVGSITDNRLGGWYSYRASKAAQNMLTRTLSIEWSRGSAPIICLALHPGTVRTDLSEPFLGATDPGKVFSTERAVRQLLTILDDVSMEDTGRFIAWDGQTIPW